MDFAHYTDEPVVLATALVNTFGWVSGTEFLASAADLDAFMADHGGAWVQGLPSSQKADLEEVRELRTRLRSVFEAGDTSAAAAVINGILADYGATPHISVHDGPAHMHFEPVEASLAAWLGVVTSMGLATVLAEGGAERLGICAVSDCDDAFVDASRNRSRRNCSTTCGTRQHVAAHRERKRLDG